jgi:Asp-tRNA(Asn)/Glu-tRNA(Gln) amidotransferase A subunit family amidase
MVQTHLSRIDAVNPALNAIVIRLDEQTLAPADAADRAVAAGAAVAAHSAWRPAIAGPETDGLL